MNFDNKKSNCKRQYIKKFFQTNAKEIRAGLPTPEEAKIYHSNMWYDKCSLENNDYTLSELLNLRHRSLEIKNKRITGKHGGNAIIGHNGLWRIYVHPSNRKSLDFDIAVKAGNGYRFHSKVIKHSILSRHGNTAYAMWRKAVKNDIDSLKLLVAAIRSELTSVPWSYTCSPSAARLCEQVGVSTHRGAAFLFPSRYS